MTWHRPRHLKPNPDRERLAIGGLLPLAMLAGGFALDDDDDAVAPVSIRPAA